ncbi:unnamed protein product [Owenia fusiformis]|uniref:Uncharacterized protein n=1 Tax=Owenia fusiformis TaxID=6347 RepID=A0A8S4P0P5_OWEFU|nr:unnamed protein product [Owenia fusiformis]
MRILSRGEYYGTHPLKQERLQHVTPENRSEIYRHYDHSTELTDRNKEDIYDCVFESTRPQYKSNESSAKNFWDSNPIQVHTCDGIDKLTIGETVARPSPILHSEVSKIGFLSTFHALVKRDDHASHNSEFFRTLHHICPKLMNLRHLTIRDFLVNDSFNDVCDVINDAITRTRVTSLDTLLQLPISMILQKYSDPSLGENVSLPVNARLASQKPTLLTHLCVKLNLNGVIPTVLYTIDSKGDITVDTYNLKSLSTYAYIDIGAYGRSKCTNFKVVCALIKHSSNLKILSLSGCRWIEIMELTSLINHTTLPNLTALTLDSFDLKWVHVLRIVEYNPSLESLTLRDCSLSRFAQNEFEDLSEKIGEHANLGYLDISNNPLGGSVLKLFLAIIEFRIANHAAFFKFVKFSHNGINTEDAWTLAKGMKKMSDKLHGKRLMEYLNLNQNLVKHAEIDKLIEEFGNSVGFLDIRTQIKGAMAEFVAQM